MKRDQPLIFICREVVPWCVANQFYIYISRCFSVRGILEVGLSMQIKSGGKFPIVKLKRGFMEGNIKFMELSLLFSLLPSLPNPFSSLGISVWPVGSWCGCSLWSFPQFLGQCCAVYLQCSRSSTHPDPLETPLGGQQRLVLHQPLPGLCGYQQGHPGSGPLLQLEDSDCGVWRQHRYGILPWLLLAMFGLNRGNQSVL